jgi:hypothetical protein
MGTAIDVSTIKKVKNSLNMGSGLVKWLCGKAKTASFWHNKIEVALTSVFSETVSATPSFGV